MSEPITEDELATIESRVKAARLTFRELMEYGFRLLDEVRRLRKCSQEDWCPGVPVACQKHVDQGKMELFSINVEIDNLRKMLKDLAGSRDAAIFNLEGAERREKTLVEMGQRIVSERDVLKSMLDTANEREQIQIRIATEAIKERNVAQAMSAKRYDALNQLREMTKDVGLECWTCDGLRSVIDPALFVDGIAEIDRIRKLEAIRMKATVLLSINPPCKNDLDALRDALLAMKPHPLEKLVDETLEGGCPT